GEGWRTRRPRTGTGLSAWCPLMEHLNVRVYGTRPRQPDRSRPSIWVEILRQREGGSIGDWRRRGAAWGDCSSGRYYGSTRSIFTLRRVRADSIIASVTSTPRSPSRPVA